MKRGGRLTCPAAGEDAEEDRGRRRGWGGKGAAGRGEEKPHLASIRTQNAIPSTLSASRLDLGVIANGRRIKNKGLFGTAHFMSCCELFFFCQTLISKTASWMKLFFLPSHKDISCDEVEKSR